MIVVTAANGRTRRSVIAALARRGVRLLGRPPTTFAAYVRRHLQT